MSTPAVQRAASRTANTTTTSTDATSLMLQTRDPAYDATNAATWAFEDRQSYGLAGIVYGVVIGYVRIASANTKGLVLASTHTPTTIMATEEIGPCLRRAGRTMIDAGSVKSTLFTYSPSNLREASKLTSNT